MPETPQASVVTHVESTDPEDMPISRREFKLSMSKMKSDFALVMLGSVALNQFLSGVAVPSFVTGSVVLGIAAKVVAGALMRA